MHISSNPASEMADNAQPIGVIVNVPIDSIQPAPENEHVYDQYDCRHQDDDIIYQSVKKLGILEVLTVSADGYILSGHRRHWAALMAGLEHVPIRRVDIRLSDLPMDERLRVLTAHNTQRRKGAEEQIREELVNTNPKDAYRALRERLAARQDEAYRSSPTAMRIEGQTTRSAISDAKAAFLDAVRYEVMAREAYWPLSVRQIHYAMLNNPPLRHSSKRKSRYKNDRESYKALCDLCTRARLAGSIPWDAVGDETRPVELWDCHQTVADSPRSEVHAGMLSPGFDARAT